MQAFAMGSVYQRKYSSFRLHKYTPIYMWTYQSCTRFCETLFHTDKTNRLQIRIISVCNKIPPEAIFSFLITTKSFSLCWLRTVIIRCVMYILNIHSSKRVSKIQRAWGTLSLPGSEQAATSECSTLISKTSCTHNTSFNLKIRHELRAFSRSDTNPNNINKSPAKSNTTEKVKTHHNVDKDCSLLIAPRQAAVRQSSYNWFPSLRSLRLRFGLTAPVFRAATRWL